MITTTLTRTDFLTVVAAAIRAPSILNTQPWRFRLRDGMIELLADPSRRLRVIDPTGWAMRVSCGAALFNLRLALAVLGMPAQVRLRPLPTEPDLLARLTPGPPGPVSQAEQRLYDAIARRHSNRAPFRPEPVAASARARLTEAARAEGAWLDLLVGRTPVTAVAEIAEEANRVLERDPGYRAEMSAWTRGGAARDETAAADRGPSPQPQELLPQAPLNPARSSRLDVESEPLVAVLGTAGDSAIDQLVAGQALQRVLLTATDAGLVASMLSQPIEVPSVREQLRLALSRFGTPQLVLRVGYGQPASPTPRRAPEEVIDA